MNFLDFKNYIKSEFDILLSEKQLQQFEDYLLLIQKTNKRFNITAITETEEIIEKHFIDALYLLKFIKLDNCNVIDIGSGGGIPGIPLSILCPDVQFTLIDSTNKKIIFLDMVVEKLCLKNVKTICGRIEDNIIERNSVDYIIARGVKELNILLELTMPFIKINGLLLAYKGPNIDIEVKVAKHALRVLKTQCKDIHFYNLPVCGYQRSIASFIKERDILTLYPRSYKNIIQKPL